MGMHQVNKLRQRFVIAAMVSFAIVILVIGLGINMTVVSLNRAQIRKTLDHIVNTESSNQFSKEDHNGNNSSFLEYNPFHIQLMDNVQFYKVSIRGKNITINNSNMISSSDEEIIESAKHIEAMKSNFGVDGIYSYERVEKANGTTVIAVVNYLETLNNCRRLLYLTVIFGILILVILYFLVRHFSYIAVRPEIESDRRQKEFITNASHELKTPLAVIKADAEYLEMLAGENEWSKAIMNQTDRMNGLIQNLVMIARGDETEEEEIAEVNVSKVVSEIIEPFMGLAEREKKQVVMHVNSNVKFRFEANQIRMLTSILVDNAIKYCDDNGKIEISLSQKKVGKPITFTISNSYAEGENVDYTKFFERFFRQDKSHNINGTGGYGIGLSVAESICRKNGGQIRVAWKEGVITFTCILRGERR
ncbi:MAG: HAMP domain-containing histidine kinase [Lachnospiraceae bacterium]|nr:HAMP domain-containing histidine kinase [Lachnospiraceae bacterium]